MSIFDVGSDAVWKDNDHRQPRAVRHALAKRKNRWGSGSSRVGPTLPTATGLKGSH